MTAGLAHSLIRTLRPARDRAGQPPDGHAALLADAQRDARAVADTDVAAYRQTGAAPGLRVVYKVRELRDASTL